MSLDTKSLASAALALSLFLGGCAATADDEASAEDDIEETSSADEALSATLPDGCTLTAPAKLVYAYGDEAIRGTATLSCAHAAKYTHYVAVGLQRCSGKICAYVQDTAVQPSVAPGFTGARRIDSRAAGYTSGASYRTYACDDVFKGNTFVVRRCSASPQVRAR